MSADSDFLLKVANVLDEAAKVIDSNEAEKTAAMKSARDAAMKSLAEKYSEATGEEIPQEVIEKLSSSGDDVVSSVKQLLEKTAGSSAGVEALGRSSEKAAAHKPTNKKEAASAAWDRFGEYINS